MNEKRKKEPTKIDPKLKKKIAFLLGILVTNKSLLLSEITE
jgi:hypothetical protein